MKNNILYALCFLMLFAITQTQANLEEWIKTYVTPDSDQELQDRAVPFAKWFDAQIKLETTPPRGPSEWHELEIAIEQSKKAAYSAEHGAAEYAWWLAGKRVWDKAEQARLKASRAYSDAVHQYITPADYGRLPEKAKPAFQIYQEATKKLKDAKTEALHNWQKLKEATCSYLQNKKISEQICSK